MLIALAAIVALLLLVFLWFNFKDNSVKVEDETEKKPSIESVQVSELDYVLKGENGNADIKFHYQGEVVDGSPNGKGVGTYSEGIYEGRYNQGKREDSYAIMRLYNGDTYHGSWANDYYNKGRYTFKETGMYFEGEFKNGEPYNGTYFNPNGSEYVKVKNGEELSKQ